MMTQSGSSAIDLSGREEFVRRIGCLRSRLRGVVRMVEEGRECSEVLRQVRAALHQAQDLESQHLRSHLATVVRRGRAEDVRAVIELYRLSQR